VAPRRENVETNGGRLGSGCIVFVQIRVSEGGKCDVTQAEDSEAGEAAKGEPIDLFNLCLVDVEALNARSDG
jgi:hypothetical protein